MQTLDVWPFVMTDSAGELGALAIGTGGGRVAAASEGKESEKEKLKGEEKSSATASGKGEGEGGGGHIPVFMISKADAALLERLYFNAPSSGEFIHTCIYTNTYTYTYPHTHSYNYTHTHAHVLQHALLRPSLVIGNG